MRQSLDLVLKVKPFKSFTAIHNYKILFAVKIELSINSLFFDCLLFKCRYVDTHYTEIPWQAVVLKFYSVILIFYFTTQKCHFRIAPKTFNFLYRNIYHTQPNPTLPPLPTDRDYPPHSEIHRQPPAVR